MPRASPSGTRLFPVRTRCHSLGLIPGYEKELASLTHTCGSRPMTLPVKIRPYSGYTDTAVSNFSRATESTALKFGSFRRSNTVSKVRRTLEPCSCLAARQNDSSSAVCVVAVASSTSFLSSRRPRTPHAQQTLVLACHSSWVGACPCDDESAGVNYSHRSSKGNRHMRGLLNQTANAAARTKGSIFDMIYRRTLPRLG